MTPHARRRPGSRLPRGAIVASVVLLLSASGLATGAGGLVGSAVSWPASRSLLVSEVQTGGTSASDEFIELYNGGSVPADLNGLEVVYVTSTGGTVTRKVAWAAPLLVDPGRHVLLANAAGAWATGADATYSSGLAATGGTVVLRPVGGAPLDAVGWGDAGNAYVEGSPAAAPAAGASIERLPGGLDGNARDTNDNAADFVVSTSPSPQRLSDPPTPPAAPPTPDPSAAPTASPEPGPSGTPSPDPGASSSPSPGPSSTPQPSPAPSTDPTPIPTPEPTPTASPAPTASPTPPPTPTPVPTPAPTPTPQPSASLDPTPEPTPATVAIADARALPDGAEVVIGGTLTTPPGFIESGLEAFVDDGTGGIAIHLTVAWPAVAMGDGVRVRGTLGTRYAQRILRVGATSDIQPAPMPAPVAPVLVATGSASEPLEGRQLRVAGTVASARTALADGFGVDVDDGSGPLRVVVVTASWIGSDELPAGARMTIIGVLGQHDSGGTGASGYRLYVRDRSDLVVTPEPSPSPTPSPSPSPSPTPSPTPSPSPSPSPSPTPSPSPSPSASPSPDPGTQPQPIASVRRLAVGTRVTVEGVVTSESGAILDLRTVAVQDATGGILLLLPSRDAPILARGDLVLATGKLTSRYGALEVAVAARSDVDLTGAAMLPAPRVVTARELGEAVEGSLVRAAGTITRVTRATSGAATIVADDASGSFTVSCWRPCATSAKKGFSLTVTGIAGQRASRSGAADGYRIWPRDAADIVVVAASAADPGSDDGSTGEQAGGDDTGAVTTVARAKSATGRDVTVAVTVTTAPGFIDPDPRRVVVQDASGGILVRLPADAPTVSVGDRLRLAGRVGTYGGAAQLAADDLAALSHDAVATPVTLLRAPAAADEWRLVRVDGRVQAVRRYGTTWRAEILLRAGTVVPVQGTSRSGIASTTLVEGRDASVVGIVRRASTGVTDQRSAVLPRSAADVALGPGDPTSTQGASVAAGALSEGGAAGTSGSGAGSGTPSSGGGAPGAGSSAAARDIDLADLGAHAGEPVRIGGLVSALRIDGITLDDGTGTGEVRFEAGAAPLLASIAAGDALNASGTVERPAGGTPVVIVRDAAAVARVGQLGERIPLLSMTGASTPLDATGGGDLREVSQLRVGPVALAVPGGVPVGALLGFLVLVAAGTAAALVLFRRWVSASRERSGSGIVARLSTLLAAPVDSERR